MGNPKGLIKVLWERIFVDTSKDICTYNTLLRQDYNYGNTILESILIELMQKFLEFIEEKTIIKTNVCKMGERSNHIIINHTPKCHP